MEIFDNFLIDLQTGPLWVVWWVNVIGLVISLSVPFSLVRVEARWMILVMALRVLISGWLCATLGYQRILGLANVIFWTPFVVFLWQQRNQWRVSRDVEWKMAPLAFCSHACLFGFRLCRCCAIPA